MNSKITPEIRIAQRLSETFEQRFWKYVVKTDSCWIWTGIIVRGYGYLGRGKFKQGTVGANRASWMIHHGEIPKGMEVCHNCPGGDNPLCVNPDHLWLGTQADNMRDMCAKGRHASPNYFGETHPMHKLTDKDVLDIRKRYREGKAKQQELADEYGVVQSTIGVIVRRKNWVHI